MMKFNTVRNIIKILNMKIKMGMKKKSSIILINIVIKKFLEIYYIPKTEKRIRSRICNERKKFLSLPPIHQI